LFTAQASALPIKRNTDEVEWAEFIHADKLRLLQKSGEMGFVEEFFDDLELTEKS